MAASAKFEYACRAALELTLRYDQDRPVALREIASRHQIPQPFLVQILQQLRTAGIVTSSRGSQGGYRLTAAPESVSLLDIADAVGLDCQQETSEATDEPLSRELGSVFRQANDAYRNALQQHNLRRVAERANATEATMFYI